MNTLLFIKGQRRKHLARFSWGPEVMDQGLESNSLSSFIFSTLPFPIEPFFIISQRYWWTCANLQCCSLSPALELRIEADLWVAGCALSPLISHCARHCRGYGDKSSMFPTVEEFQVNCSWSRVGHRVELLFRLNTVRLIHANAPVSIYML